MGQRSQIFVFYNGELTIVSHYQCSFGMQI